ncbi:hypothetical protein [Actinoplanes sp. NPDC023714]|uniref:hypothetical protein n=1 Tax=Actinoplanes sp. NPDC023714 TaxID=3154322 RepID=UPI0033DF7B8E
MNTTEKTRPPVAARRTGYGVAAALAVVMLYLINGAPGWDAVPFLTADTAGVIPLVNLSLIVGLVVDLTELVADPPWLVALGGILSTAAGLPALIALWRVFPFDFGTAAFDWALLTRVVLVVGVAGSVIGLIAQSVRLAGALHGRPVAHARPADR